MAIISKTFSSVAGVSAQIAVKHGDSMKFSIAGTFAGEVQLEKSQDGGQSWQIAAGPYVLDPAASGTVRAEHPNLGMTLYRVNCLVYTSGSVVCSIFHAIPSIAKKRLLTTGSKVGGTAGFVVAAAANTFLITCPAGVTAGKLVVPVAGLNIGDKIVGFHLVGQVESAGNNVVFDVELRKQTAAAADVVDASVASMTQLTVAADTILSASNTLKEGLDLVVAEDETYYVIVTGTTAASTDIALQGVALLVVPA